jgi:hypothetical protein
VFLIEQLIPCEFRSSLLDIIHIAKRSEDV